MNNCHTLNSLHRSGCLPLKCFAKFEGLSPFVPKALRQKLLQYKSSKLNAKLHWSSGPVAAPEASHTLMLMLTSFLPLYLTSDYTCWFIMLTSSVLQDLLQLLSCFWYLWHHRKQAPLFSETSLLGALFQHPDKILGAALSLDNAQQLSYCTYKTCVRTFKTLLHYIVL